MNVEKLSRSASPFKGPQHPQLRQQTACKRPQKSGENSLRLHTPTDEIEQNRKSEPKLPVNIVASWV